MIDVTEESLTNESMYSLTRSNPQKLQARLHTAREPFGGLNSAKIKWPPNVSQPCRFGFGFRAQIGKLPLKQGITYSSSCLAGHTHTQTSTYTTAAAALLSVCSTPRTIINIHT